MTVFFTIHSQQRFVQRGITMKMVTETLKNPEEQGIAKNNNKFAIKTFKKKRLKVIFQEKKNHEIIITAYFQS